MTGRNETATKSLHVSTKDDTRGLRARIDPGLSLFWIHTHPPCEEIYWGRDGLASYRCMRPGLAPPDDVRRMIRH